MLGKAAALLALGLAAGGCTHLSSPAAAGTPVAREELKNAEGHVVGIKEVTLDGATGERITQISLFIPRLQRGRVVGYEERVRGGSVLRDLDGKRIGGRFDDLRSRAANPHSRGVVIVVLPREDRLAAAPSIEELIRIARLEN